MATWYRKSPGGSTYEQFTNGSTTFSTAGRWYIKYVDDGGCETESTYDVTRCCTCSDFSASRNSVSFGSGADSSTVTFNQTGTCSGSLTGLTASRGSYDWITIGFNSSHNTLTISVSANADTTRGRTGSITISYNGSPCNDLTITVEQSQATPGGCTCDNLSVDTSPASFGSGADSTTRSCNKTGTCNGEINQPDVATSDDGNWCTASYNSGTITIRVSEYSSGSGNRTATVTPKINNNSCSSKAITVTQTPPSAKCYNITPTSGNVSGNCTGGTVGFTATETPC